MLETVIYICVPVTKEYYHKHHSSIVAKEALTAVLAAKESEAHDFMIHCYWVQFAAGACKLQK